MKICQAHWAKMRAKIDALGLTHLIAADGKEAMDRAVRELEAAEEGTKPDKTDFDPLMAMTWSFTNTVLERSGIGVMMQRSPEPDGMPANDGDYCPLCIVRRDFDTHNTETGRCGDPACTVKIEPGEQPWDEYWIEDCGNSMHTHAVSLGLVTQQ